MIANISPAGASCGETVNTLRYAARVKDIGKGGAPKGPSANPSPAAANNNNPNNNLNASMVNPKPETINLKPKT